MDRVPPPENVWRDDLERELGWMRTLARRLVHGEDEAHDLVQETWVAALARPPGDRSRPRAWLRTVMSNLVRRDGRRARVRYGRVVLEPEVIDEGPLPGHDQEQSELEQLLKSELLLLDEPFRSTLRVHYLEGLPLIEIARREHVPDGTVRWRLKAGLERLKMRLDARYGDRRRWLAALLGFAGPRPTRVAPPPSAPALPLGASAAVVLVLAGLALWVSGWFEADTEPLETETSVARASAARFEERTRPASTSALEPPPSPIAESTANLSLALALTVRTSDGTPLAGAEILVYGAQGFEPRATTDATGQASFTPTSADFGTLAVPMAHDRVVLRAAAAGHATSEALFWREDGPRALELVLGGSERILRGRVQEAGGAPLAGVELHAVLDPLRTTLDSEDALFTGPLALGTRSAEDGTYELRGLAARPYAVVVARPRCEPTLLLVDAEKQELPLVFVPEGKLRGRIEDEHGRPAAGVRVWLEPLHVGGAWCAGIPGYRADLGGFALETLTAADGTYELFDVLARQRRVRATDPLDPARTVGAFLPLQTGALSEWSARLARESGLRLHLVDEDGADLAGWVVRCLSSRSEGGRVTRQEVADRTGRVACFAGEGPFDVLVFPPSGEGEPRFSRRLTASADEYSLVVPSETGTYLVGRVPVDCLAADPSASVIAYHFASRQPFTLELERDSGRFHAELEAARYSLILSGDHGAAWLADVSLMKGERRRLGRFEPPPTGHAFLRADRDAERGGSYRLELCVGANSVAWRQAALPLFEELELRAGLYRLDTAGSGTGPESAWLSVPPGGHAELDLTRLARVEVRVSSELTTQDKPLWLVARTKGESPQGTPLEPVRRVRLPRRAEGDSSYALRLPEGPWELTLCVEEDVLRQSRLDVPAGGARLIEFH